jgi:hypothetical protein
MDRCRAGRPINTLPREPAPADVVAKAAKHLKNKTLLLIGGDFRPAPRDALIKALRLKDLVWVSNGIRSSHYTFKPYIARQDIFLVLLAIPWIRHSYAKINEFCEEYGKPLVRLPGGYNPNQVAAQILAQCGFRFAQANGQTA